MTLDIADIKAKILKFLNYRSVKHGLPFVLFIVGGSFGLREFTNVRYEYRATKQVQDNLESSGIPMKEKHETTLEATYETIKELDTDNWENKRIARPWEPETLKT
ncbi:cytochrome c oxidase assembly protein COX16 homolog, mitochondrial [Diachasma alloeum]|uniref:cytochrome c oxidase assembly protein COX16 homolog, mitochondrial n=1 Tax=Diachasma alloeum TaxID=454923 RepID=UPI000738494D|nr:cytochrome c oxidase assembly protein COX16 homolog, mitochondrial [Diachasma alloeum]XP_015119903.1 cytochrome c oxidase assembly protein COX16 homolog, mitochondrial [Diachasma alloeum]